MKAKNNKLRIGSLSLAVLMVLQLCFFCPCTYAESNRLMRLLKDGINLTVEDIKPLVESNPYQVKEIYNGKNRKRKTVLYYALCRGENTIENRVAIAQYLIEKGASVGPIFEGGITPLHWAARYGHEGGVRLFLEKGVDPNQAAKGGITPLCVAVMGAHPGESASRVKGLVESVISDIIISFDKSESKSEYKGQESYDACVSALLKKGADPNRCDDKGFTPLHYAAQCGKEACVRLLLKEGANPNKAGKDSMTPLHCAAQNGSISCAQLLLKKGANPNLKNENARTPLHFAAFYNQESLARLLLKNGADWRKSDKDGKTPYELAGGYDYGYCSAKGVRDLFESYDRISSDLCRAAGVGNIDKVRSLLESGVNLNSGYRTPLECAVENGHEACASLLIERGANPNLNIHGETPLYKAVKHGDEACVRLLLEKDADPNYQYGYKTLLHCAVKNGCEACVRLLLDKGADMNRAINRHGYVDDGMTPLHYAAYKGRKACVRALLEKGANPNQAISDSDSYNYGKTPLHFAAKEGYEACVRLLLDNGADLNRGDGKGATPLIVANEACYELLLERGADPNKGDNEGWTPLHDAAWWCNPYRVELLLKKDVDLNRAFSKPGDYMDGWTPLHCAVDNLWGPNVDCVRLLLEKGADPNCVDKKGRTPRDICKNSEIDKLLEVHGGKKNSICIIM